MRCTIGVVALALIICPGSVDAGNPERTVVMKISGVPGQFTVQVDQDGWSQLQALQAPGAPSGAGSSNPLSSRGTSSLASRGSGGGAGSGPAGIQEITITKTDDQSSTNLFDHCATGKHLPEVTLEFVDTAGGNERGYTSYELVNAVVGSFHTGSTGSEGQQTETLTINFTEIRVTNTQSERGWGEAEQRATPPPYTYTPRHR
jgi:type VI protein secretion system component Hcp